MKKSIIAKALVIAALAAAGQVTAQETPWYLTGSIGQSKFDIEGLPGDNKDTSFNVGVGYNFSKNVGLEAGYADFGKTQFSGVTGKAQSAYVGVILSAPLSDVFSVYGRLAAASTDRSVAGFGSKVSERKTEAFYGVGLAYAFTRNLSGTLEYQALNDSDVSAINVGVRLGF